MSHPKLRVGQSITPEQFEELSDEQLVRLVPRAWREFFPGKDFCADGHFYLHDGSAWSFFKGRPARRVRSGRPRCTWPPKRCKCRADAAPVQRRH